MASVVCRWTLQCCVVSDYVSIVKLTVCSVAMTGFYIACGFQ